MVLTAIPDTSAYKTRISEYHNPFTMHNYCLNMYFQKKKCLKAIKAQLPRSEFQLKFNSLKVHRMLLSDTGEGFAFSTLPHISSTFSSRSSPLRCSQIASVSKISKAFRNVFLNSHLATPSVHQESPLLKILSALCVSLNLYLNPPGTEGKPRLGSSPSLHGTSNFWKERKNAI